MPRQQWNVTVEARFIENIFYIPTLNFKTLDVFLSECFARRVIFIRAAGAVRTWADVYNVGVAGVVFRMVGAVLYIALDMIDALFKFGGCGVLT